MDREEVRNTLIGVKSNNILAILPTSYGKSKIGLDILKAKGCKNILIVVPKLVLIDNWKREIKKWWGSERVNITFSTYVGIHKHNLQKYDACLFDEAHHITERVQEYIKYNKCAVNILLSATVGYDKRGELSEAFPDLYIHRISSRQAIDEKVLPEPTVYLLPLTLDNTKQTGKFIARSSKYGKSITVPYEQKWQYLTNKNYNSVTLLCTPKQLNMEYNNQVEYWKKKFMSTNSPVCKNKWLNMSLSRLRALSDLKTDIISTLLGKLHNHRYLVFCNSQQQAKDLGDNCIISSNPRAQSILRDFNDNRINYVTSVNMLAEGVNLSSCQIGVYASLNSSETLMVQKLGK